MTLKSPHDEANGCPLTERVCAAAAQEGELEALTWAREEQCPWGSHLFNNAAAGGHLEVMQWAFANGCQVDFSSWARVCNAAAGYGHLDCLQWVVSNASKKPGFLHVGSRVETDAAIVNSIMLDMLSWRG